MKIDKEKALHLYREGLSDCQIAKILDLSCATIGNWRKRNGLDPNYEKSLPHKHNTARSKSDTQDTPWTDSKSLFYDTKFLECLFKKEIIDCGTNA